MAKPAAMKILTVENSKSDTDLHLRLVGAAKKVSEPQSPVNRNRAKPEISDDADDLWDNVPV